MRYAINMNVCPGTKLYFPPSWTFNTVIGDGGRVEANCTYLRWSDSDLFPHRISPIPSPLQLIGAGGHPPPSQFVARHTISSVTRSQYAKHFSAGSILKRKTKQTPNKELALNEQPSPSRSMLQFQSVWTFIVSGRAYVVFRKTLPVCQSALPLPNIEVRTEKDS